MHPSIAELRSIVRHEAKHTVKAMDASFPDRRNWARCRSTLDFGEARCLATDGASAAGGHRLLQEQALSIIMDNATCSLPKRGPAKMVDVVTESLAERVRQEREGRGWSLADLAQRSGVSRAMISKIERAEASPTAELLHRLCAGFGIPLAAIFSAPNTTSPVSRRADQPEWRDPATGYIRRNISPAGFPATAQIVDVVFPPRARVVFDNLRDTVVEQQIWMLEGCMQLTIGRETYLLETGDCLAMRLDRPITFRNPSEQPARYAVVLTQPGSAG
jgi:transcriptional regulator with XRE-family HTH domain